MEEDVKPKYLPGDNAWAMYKDKPKMVTVFSATLKNKYQAMGPMIWIYNIYPSDSLYGVSYDRTIATDQSEIFSTKEELIASL